MIYYYGPQKICFYHFVWEGWLTILLYCPCEIIDNIPFHFQKCASLDSKLYITPASKLGQQGFEPWPLWVRTVGITRLNVRRLPRAEARNSLFSPAFGTGFIPGCSQRGIKHPVYSVCRRSPSLLIGFLSCCVFFFLLVFLALSSLNGSHFDPFTKFSFRISQLTFKGNFTWPQRGSLEVFNIKKHLRSG